MIIKKGDYVKHFKGKNLIEKNIYEIIAVKPTYTGDDSKFPEIIIYSPVFQPDKCFVREYADLVSELTQEQQELYHQQHRIDILTEAELALIKTDKFIKEKMAYMEEKENENANKNENKKKL